MYRGFDGPRPPPRHGGFRPQAPPAVRMPHRGPMYHPPRHFSSRSELRPSPPFWPSSPSNNFHNYPVQRPPTGYRSIDTHYGHALHIPQSNYFTTPALSSIATSFRTPSPSPKIPSSTPSDLSIPLQSPISTSSNAPSSISLTPQSTPTTDLSLPLEPSTTSDLSNPLQSSISTMSSAPSSISLTPQSTPTTDLSLPLEPSTTSDLSKPLQSSTSTMSSAPSSADISCPPESTQAVPSPNLKNRLRSASGCRAVTDLSKLSEDITVIQSSSESAGSDHEDVKYHYGQNNKRKRQKSSSKSSNLKHRKGKETNWRAQTLPKETPKKSEISKVPPLMPSTSSKSLNYHRVMFHDSSLDEKMVDRVLANVNQTQSVPWSAVCGLNDVKQQLKEMVIYPMLNPALFQGLRRAGKGLLLFGPPGTGKTLIGKCLATEARATFFSVTASTFGSKWYGEAESLAKTLFACARALQPSIIFIDEVDSILCARETDSSGCATRLRTELLACMDGCSTNSEDRVLLVGATNWPGKIEEAARRRFNRRCYVPLPDVETRIEQFKYELRREKHDITEKEMHILAEKTEGYSGADITQVCLNAGMKPIRSLDPTSVSIEFLTVDDVRPLNVNDFLESINEIPKSVSREMINQLEKFNKQFGTR